MRECKMVLINPVSVSVIGHRVRILNITVIQIIVSRICVNEKMWQRKIVLVGQSRDTTLLIDFILRLYLIPRFVLYQIQTFFTRLSYEDLEEANSVH